jgi:hypothetical protein
MRKMKTLQFAFASGLVGALIAGTAVAQTTMLSPVQQPGSIQRMAFQADEASGYAVADPVPPAPAVSPSNTPPTPPVAKPGEKPAAEAPKEEKKEEEKKPDEPPPAPVTIFHGDWLDAHHLSLRGFFDVGMGYNPDSPVTRFNGPVAYDDRSNEVQLNQFYGIAERVAKVENDCGVDYGYRADILYGTDRRFIQTIPGSAWDSGWDNGNRFYGLCMPQFYGTLQYNKLTLEGGHFYAPCGYEVANADANVFYSHTYGFLYGMPTTLTGGYGTYKVKDKLLVNAGFDTGWNEGFQSINGRPNFFFGGNWTSSDKDGKFNVISECFIGNTQATPGVDDSTRVMVCTDVTIKLGEKWTYILENTVAHDSDTPNSTAPVPPLAPAGTVGMGPASWTGFTNYLIYAINDCWQFGFRYEYFEDLNGAVVTQVGPPTILEPGSKWNDLTLGLNWKPNLNVTMRSEVRWDWASNMAPTGAKAFDSGSTNGQFTWGNDIIVRF